MLLLCSAEPALFSCLPVKQEGAKVQEEEEDKCEHMCSCQFQYPAQKHVNRFSLSPLVAPVKCKLDVWTSTFLLAETTNADMNPEP